MSIGKNKKFRKIEEEKRAEELFTGRKEIKDPLFLNHIREIREEIETGEVSRHEHVIYLNGMCGVGKSAMNDELIRFVSGSVNKDSKLKFRYIDFKFGNISNRDEESFIKSFLESCRKEKSKEPSVKDIKYIYKNFPFTVGALAKEGIFIHEKCIERPRNGIGIRLKRIGVLVVEYIASTFAAYVVGLLAEYIASKWGGDLSIPNWLSLLLGFLVPLIINIFPSSFAELIAGFFYKVDSDKNLEMRTINHYMKRYGKKELIKKELHFFHEEHRFPDLWRMKVIDYFFEELSSFITCNHPYVVFIDEIEYNNYTESRFFELVDYSDDSSVKLIARMIKKIRPVLWVINGREENCLKSALEKNFIDERKLENFTNEEVKEYMNKAGIDLVLKEKFIRISKGNPYLLNLLYETYFYYKENKPGTELKLDVYSLDSSEFLGKTRERYFKRFRNQSSKRLFSFLICLEHGWTDVFIDYMREKKSSSIFDKVIYDEVKNLSIIKKENGRYSFNEDVRQIFLGLLSEKEKKDNINLYAAGLTEKIEDGDKDEIVDEICEFASLKTERSEQLFCDTIEGIYREFVIENKLDKARRILAVFESNVSSSKNIRFRFWIMFSKFYYYFFFNAWNDAERMQKLCKSYLDNNTELRKEVEDKELLDLIYLDIAEINLHAPRCSNYYFVRRFLRKDTQGEEWNRFEKGLDARAAAKKKKNLNEKEVSELKKIFESALSAGKDDIYFDLMCRQELLDMEMKEYGRLGKIKKIESFKKKVIDSLGGKDDFSYSFCSFWNFSGYWYRNLDELSFDASEGGVDDSEKTDEAEESAKRDFFDESKEAFLFYYEWLGPYNTVILDTVNDIHSCASFLDENDYDTEFISHISKNGISDRMLKSLYDGTSSDDGKYAQIGTVKDFVSKYGTYNEGCWKIDNMESDGYRYLCKLYGREVKNLYWLLYGHKLDASENKSSASTNPIGYGNNEIKEAIIPSGIKVLPDNSFARCSNLEKIIFNEEIIEIGRGAFANCPKLESVVIPDSVKIIREQAFNKCFSLKAVKLPGKLEKLGGFSNCPNLGRIDIPDGVSEMSGFNYCNSLVECNMPSNLKIISGRVFNNCPDIDMTFVVRKDMRFTEPGCLKKYYGKIRIDDGMECLPKNLDFVGAKLSSVDIPSSMKSIRNESFNNCKELEEVIIHNGVESIGDKAFGECSNLKTVSIPDSVVLIGKSAFEYCDDKLESITLPDGITEIGARAFACCLSLKTINMPEGLKKIGKEAFAYCIRMDGEIILPEGLVLIEEGAFVENSFKVICIPKKTIIVNEEETFYHCSGRVFRY